LCVEDMISRVQNLDSKRISPWKFISMALRYRGKLEKPIPKEQVLCYLTYVNITRNQV
jgi:hypothetical protein